MIMTMYVCVDHWGVSVLQGLVLGGGLHRGELSYYEQPFFGIFFFFQYWAQEAQNFLRNSFLASSLFLSPSLSLRIGPETGYGKIGQDRTGGSNSTPGKERRTHRYTVTGTGTHARTDFRDHIIITTAKKASKCLP